MGANIFEPEWDAEQDRPPFVWRRSRIGRQAGAEKLGASLFEVPPGSSAFPLHVHYANEELIVVISGSFVMRGVNGAERALSAGDVVACPAGPRGAHRLDNRSDEPARFFIVSTMLAPDFVDYPDSNKVWMRSYAPGGAPGDEEYDVLIAKGEQLDYLHGEE
jgi:uncharacterized cupin superfamily protein